MAFVPQSQSPPSPARRLDHAPSVARPAPLPDLEMRREAVRVLYERGELEAAGLLLDETLQSAPTDVDLRLRLSQVDFYRGRSSRAVESVLEVLRSEPTHVEALGQLAIFFLLMNHGEEARLGLSRLARLSPPYDYVHAASVFALFGEDGGVLKCFAEGRENGVSSARLSHFAGVALARLGSWGEAEQCWQSALDLEPALHVARANLENAVGARQRPWFLSSGEWPFSPALFRQIRETPARMERLLCEDSAFRALLPALLDRADPLTRGLALMR